MVEAMPEESNASPAYQMVLGTYFLRQYTITFDQSNKAIELAPSVTSLAGTSIVKVVPGGSNTPGLAFATIIGIAAGCFLILLCIIVACAYFIMKDNKEAD